MSLIWIWVLQPIHSELTSIITRIHSATSHRVISTRQTFKSPSTHHISNMSSSTQSTQSHHEQRPNSRPSHRSPSLELHILKQTTQSSTLTNLRDHRSSSTHSLSKKTETELSDIQGPSVTSCRVNQTQQYTQSSSTHQTLFNSFHITT
jgi:hypothetical protein